MDVLNGVYYLTLSVSSSGVLSALFLLESRIGSLFDLELLGCSFKSVVAWSLSFNFDVKKFSRFLKLMITMERLSKDFSMADYVKI